jgi:hypothetical protein
MRPLLLAGLLHEPFHMRFAPGIHDLDLRAQPPVPVSHQNQGGNHVRTS